MKVIHKRSPRKKYLLAGIVSLLVLAISLTAFALSKNHDSTKSQGANTTADQLSASDFVMVTTMGLSYRATIHSTYNGTQPERIMLIDRDGTHGASRLTRRIDDMLIATVYSGEVTYSCDRQSCQKINQSDNTEQLAYDFSMDAVQRLAHRVTYKGEAPCPAGTCLVWDALPDDTTVPQYSQTLYIDKRTKSVSKVIRIYKDSGYKDTITYDYTPRSITLPPLPQEVPII